MLKRLSRMFFRDYCRLDVGEASIRAVRESPAGDAEFLVARRSLVGASTATLDELTDSISMVLADVHSGGSPVHAILGDELVRYFIVTPPVNGSSMADLQGAAVVRFEGLYGELSSTWHIVADWQGAAPFVACAVPRQIFDAVRSAADRQRSSLVSVAPAFVFAWNRSRHDVSADTWLGTLSGGTLTLGLVAGDSRPRLIAVRSLASRNDHWSTAQICQQVAHSASLEGVAAPCSLHVHDFACDAPRLQPGPADHGGITVQWHSTNGATREGPRTSAAHRWMNACVRRC